MSAPYPPASPDSASHAPRKRVSQACQPCGLKKIKCDGDLPKCTPCKTKELDCTYGLSKRRARTGIPGSPRPHSFLPHPSPQARDEAQRPLPNAHYALPPINRAHDHKPAQRFYSTVSPEVSTRLFQSYFNCIHPLWPILYKPLYASLDYASPAEMMPPPLIAAIYAIASCVDKSQNHTSNSTVPRYPEPRQFFEEALDLLHEGNEGREPFNTFTPSITSCQVLAILLLQQHGLAEYSRAAMLCGLASAMAIEIRIHRQPDFNDAIQVEVQSRLWWNLYILEKMISCEMGKPIFLRSEESDCSLPSLSEADEFELMSSHTRNSRPSDQVRNSSIKLHTISILHTSVKLCFVMERISREIYGLKARKAIRANQSEGEKKRMDIWMDLREWERDIETSPLKLDLSDDLTSVPGAITNYVIMWHGTILLHRPFIARWAPESAEPSSAMNPLHICLQAANNICLILEKYFDKLPGLPCDMVFSVFTAASTLLYNSKQTETATEDTRNRLKLCIHWLSVLGKSWKTAGARQQLLSDMYDLPRHLQGTPNVQMMQPAPQSSFGQGTPRSEPMSASPSNGNFGAGNAQPSEDWTFLTDFGDPTDEFYSMDVQLLGLLIGQESGGFV